LQALGGRDFKHVVDLLWEPPPLAADAAFLARYVAELRARDSGPALRRLALQWLLMFAAERPGMAEIAGVLRSEAPRLRGAMSAPDTARRLFDPVAGPVSLATELAHGSGEPADVLARHGLRGAAAEGGFVQTAFLWLLATLRQHLTAAQGACPPLFERVRALATNAKGEPRFRELRAAFAEALLLPFAGMEPARATRELIETELLGRLGDPRVDAAAWAGVSAAAKDVMLRWLTEATLEAFIAIVRRHADPEHWRYREAFWRAFLRAGHIRTAQVAFGPAARQEVQTLARRENDPRLRVFARLEGSGVLANHAVLLLRIGDLTLAEWSHTGALRIWKAGQRGAPRLEQRSFDAANLRDPKAAKFTHHGSQSGSWQAAVAGAVLHETGIVVGRSEYMPRR
jgi:hypothetical protein